MMDILSKRNSQGFRVLRYQVRKLGDEAYEKYGCNFVAILVDEPETNCEDGLSKRKPSMIYKTPGANGFLDDYTVKGDLNLLAERLVAHVQGKILHQGHNDGNLSSDLDLDFDDTSDSSLSGDPDPELSGYSGPCPRNRPPTCIRRPYFINAKKAIVNEATKAGVDIHWRVLPWKRLLFICANFGVYINNYPDGLDSPFDSAPNLGLCGLSDDEHETLIHALKREKRWPMRFLRAENVHDIMNNKFPVLIYAPPSPDNPRPRSKRIFLDETYDYKGHRQLEVEIIRDVDNERQEKRPCGRKVIYRNIQELESHDPVQHSGSKRPLIVSYADRPEKRMRFVGA